jgi:hypothetical protein
MAKPSMMMRFAMLFSRSEKSLFINNCAVHFSGEAAAVEISQPARLVETGIRTAEVDQSAISAARKPFSNQASPPKTHVTPGMLICHISHLKIRDCIFYKRLVWWGIHAANAPMFSSSGL